MKSFLLGTVSIGTVSIMLAGLPLLPMSRAVAAPATQQSPDDIEGLNKDIAKLRAQNAALRERDRLREQNSALRERDRLRREQIDSNRQAAAASSAPAPRPSPAAVRNEPLLGLESGRPTVLMDYAGDVPPDLLFKAPSSARGQFSFWVEGGAVWAGGDPIYNFYPNGGYLGLLNWPGFFAFTPNIGWDAAAGFDYRFGNSPWHVSGEVRYGQNRISSSTAQGGSISEGAETLSGSASVVGTDNETHWLADFTVGRDLGIGQDAMQVKGGVRFAQVTANSGVNENLTATFSGLPPQKTIGGGTTTSITASSLYNNTLDSRFLGAGPVIGVQGAVPVWGALAFDYRADAAVLIGSQNVALNGATRITESPITSAIFLFTNSPFGPFVTSNTVAIFNGDIQAGFSYWVTSNVKVTASYRLDAFPGVLKTFDAAGNAVTVNRYYQGPQLALTAKF